MNEKLNFQDLIDLLVNRHGFEDKKAETFIKEFFSLIEEGLEKDKLVKIKGWGTFKLIDVESRESINVNTGERIEIQGHTKISFIPDTALRDIINKPFAYFETIVLNDDVDFNDMVEDIPELEEVEEKVEIIEEKVEIIEEKVEIIEEKEVIVPISPKEKEKDPSRNEALTLVIILIFLICGIFLYFILFPEKDKQFSTVTPLVENVTDSIPTDSAEKPVTIVEKPAPATKPVTNNVRRKLSVPFSQILVYADSTSYKITGTRARHTIKEGQTLIRISYRYYGTKDLWPYLVIHNRSVIKDPNLLPVGMAIDIPALKKK